MAAHTTYITLDSCITDYLTESEQNNHKYWKLWHLSFRCLEQLGLDFFYRIRSVKLPVNSNLTVTLPADYLNWSKVGILNAKGEIIPLYHNEKLTSYADLLPDREDKINDPESLWLQWNGNSNTWCNYWDGGRYTNVYGVSSGEPFVGSFKVDTANGVILLSENFNRDYIMLEYVSSPSENETYRVPMQFRETLIAWLWWKDSSAIPSRTHINLGDKASKRHEYYNERRNAIARWKPFRISEAYQVSQEQSRLAVKT